jgi:hypothetical protein
MNAQGTQSKAQKASVFGEGVLRFQKAGRNVVVAVELNVIE